MKMPRLKSLLVVVPPVTEGVEDAELETMAVVLLYGETSVLGVDDGGDGA